MTFKDGALVTYDKIHLVLYVPVPFVQLICCKCLVCCASNL